MKRVFSFSSEYIISEDEKIEIVKWVENNKQEFDKNGFNRWKQHLDYFDDLPHIFNTIKQRIIERENLQSYEYEPLFRDSIAYMIDGGKLHEHIDPKHKGKEHIRFNVYVQLPEKGGRPIYDNVQHNLKERQYICCKASIDRHSATQCYGQRARVMISYGFLIPLNEVGIVVYDYPHEE